MFTSSAAGSDKIGYKAGHFLIGSSFGSRFLTLYILTSRFLPRPMDNFAALLECCRMLVSCISVGSRARVERDGRARKKEKTNNLLGEKLTENGEENTRGTLSPADGRAPPG